VSHDRPTPAELAEAAREFLEREVLPTLDDRRLRFRMLVAINGLGILQRQLESGEAGTDAAELSARLRSGDPPSAAELKEHVAAKLRVASPAYLQRYR